MAYPFCRSNEQDGPCARRPGASAAGSASKRPAILPWPFLLHEKTAAGPGPPPRRTLSAAQSEPRNQHLVARFVLRLQIVEQATALRDELQEAAPRMVVLHVALEVLGQIGDALRKDRYLDFGRSGVAVLRRVFLDQFLLAISGDRHRPSSMFRCRAAPGPASD